MKIKLLSLLLLAAIAGHGQQNQQFHLCVLVYPDLGWCIHFTNDNWATSADIREYTEPPAEHAAWYNYEAILLPTIWDSKESAVAYAKAHFTTYALCVHHNWVENEKVISYNKNHAKAKAKATQPQCVF